MITIPKASTGGQGTGRWWLSMAFTGTTDWIAIEPNMTSISVTLKPAAGKTARIEHTLSDPATIAAGNAIWVPWDLGDITAGLSDSLMTTASAIRGVSSGGTATLEVVAR